MVKQLFYRGSGASCRVGTGPGGVLVAPELYFIVLELRHVILSGVEQNIWPLSTDMLSMTWQSCWMFWGEWGPGE